AVAGDPTPRTDAGESPSRLIVPVGGDGRGESRQLISKFRIHRHTAQTTGSELPAACIGPLVGPTDRITGDRATPQGPQQETP
ncbi:hypothetical protein GA0061077_1094, partial [Bifidobacterium commune]